MKKNLLVIFLIFSLLMMMVACGAKDKETGSKTVTEFEPYTITDHTGKEVTISSPIERVAIVQVPLAATYVAYMNGSAERLVGLSGSVLETISKTLLPEIAPEILNVSTGFYENGELNIEELIKLDPDIVFYNAGNAEHTELFAKAGITAVGFSTAGTNSGSGDPTQLYDAWLRLLDTVFQGEHKDTMGKLLDNGNGLIDTIKSRVSTLSDEEKADTMILFSWQDGTPMVSGSEKHFGHYWLSNLNVNNVAAEVTGVQQVNLEQIYKWNPDYILMPGAGQISITPEEVINNTVENADFSPINAVQNRNVYSCELGLWSWYTPNSDAPIVLLWMAKNIYPDKFKDLDLKNEIKRHYKLAYNYKLTDEQVTDLLDRTDK